MEGKSHYSLFNFKKKKSQPSFSKLVYIISTRSDVKFLFLKLNFFLVVGKVVVSLQVGKSARGHYNIIDEVWIGAVAVGSEKKGSIWERFYR